MRILSVVVLMAVALPILGGCCDQENKRIQQLTILNREQGKMLVDKDTQIAQLQERLKWLEEGATGTKAEVAAKLAEMSRLQQQIAALQDELARRNAAYEELAQKCAGQGGGGRLPTGTVLKLKALAQNYPTLLSFDEATGQVRFASDVTFDSGSDAVKTDAREALTKLAAILQDPEAKTILVEVVGHTDNVPVKKPETVARFRNNQGLSEARAAAVKAVLAAAGVDGSRVMTKGMGESQPIAPNTTKEGQAKNRRVDIFLKMP